MGLLLYLFLTLRVSPPALEGPATSEKIVSSEERARRPVNKSLWSEEQVAPTERKEDGAHNCARKGPRVSLTNTERRRRRNDGGLYDNHDDRNNHAYQPPPHCLDSQNEGQTGNSSGDPPHTYNGVSDARPREPHTVRLPSPR